MASLTNENNTTAGLSVPLDWKPTDGWVDTTEEVRDLVGITRYSYTSSFRDHLLWFILRFVNTVPHRLVFVDSTGKKHSVDATPVGEHTIEFSAMAAPTIVSVYILADTPNETLSGEEITLSNGGMDWDLGEKGVWVKTSPEIQQKARISRYQFYREVAAAGEARFYLYITNDRPARYVFKDAAGMKIPLPAQTPGNNHTEATGVTPPLVALLAIFP